MCHLVGQKKWLHKIRAEMLLFTRMCKIVCISPTVNFWQTYKLVVHQKNATWVFFTYLLNLFKRLKWDFYEHCIGIISKKSKKASFFSNFPLFFAGTKAWHWHTYQSTHIKFTSSDEDLFFPKLKTIVDFS